jgi:hypothetical protein
MRHIERLRLILLFNFIISLLHAQGTYPLQVGNVWQYQDRWDSTYRFTTRAVADTLMPNGQHYTVLVSDHELDTLFFRQESSKVYNYAKHRITDSTFWHGDELWYDFSKTYLDTVTVRFYRAVVGGVEYTDTVMVTVTGDWYSTVFGKTRRQWGFYEQSLLYSMYAVRDIADSIGMTFYQYEPGAFSYDLKGAIINGVKYGPITEVDSRGTFVPGNYELLQNYPNPFNPHTTITFSLPHASRVALYVINVLGEATEMLVDSRMEPGVYNITFNASSLPSGVYFYQLRTSVGIITKKMTVLK